MVVPRLYCLYSEIELHTKLNYTDKTLFPSILSKAVAKPTDCKEKNPSEYFDVTSDLSFVVKSTLCLNLYCEIQ